MENNFSPYALFFEHFLEYWSSERLQQKCECAGSDPVLRASDIDNGVDWKQISRTSLSPPRYNFSRHKSLPTTAIMSFLPISANFQISQITLRSRFENIPTINKKILKSKKFKNKSSCNKNVKYYLAWKRLKHHLKKFLFKKNYR